ncbi:transporter substrate-binding domain-containing protein [Ramlibacter albus]|uniref:Transporter substrate-binding domain-containing protein n=1 Tax=Ramlibacter albus TaxID=2079448 RepID=A0A923MD64_9BURK|nr:transporter substrate-binding domain-containing protein [Ramlibacter albus]MBC5767263.1 transporter substrate-binding domain-containing protein [Ramlibacter albus]
MKTPLRLLGAAACTLALAGCAALPPAPRAELAPTGTWRVAVNYGNVVLGKRAASGEMEGVMVDLARAAAQRAGLPLELRVFASPSQAFESLARGEVDATFLAYEASRAEKVDYTTPYAQLQASYLVPAGSPLASVTEADRGGVRIAATTNAGYELYLRRALKAATLVSTPADVDVVAMVLQGRAEVAAGLRQAMLQEVRKRPGVRLLEGDFMLIDHAMAVPKGRDAARKWLSEFVEDAKKTGFMADALRRHGSEGARAAPLQP